MSLSYSSADQFINFALSIASMQVSGKAWLQTPRAMWMLRLAYACSNLFQLAMFFYIRHRIEKTNDQRKVRIKKEASLFQENEAEEEIEMTYAEYDKAELMKSSRSAMVQFLIFCVAHWKWKIVQPLIVQSLSPVKSMFLNPLYLAYLWNRPVLRPFELNVLFQKVAPVPEKKRVKEE